MSVDLERNHALFRKLDQLLSKTRAKPLPERVHQVRTTARRIEALIEALYPKPQGAEKLLKRLARLRRRAGKVRDIDVQMLALRTLKIGREAARKAQLMQALADMRSRREEKFTAVLERRRVQKLRKGLHRMASMLPQPALAVEEAEAPALEVNGAGELVEVAPGQAAGVEARTEQQPKAEASGALEITFDPAPQALQMFARLARRERALTEANLHQFRTGCKRIRYVAEMGGDDPQARHIVELLKRVQDAVGDWHDWETLTQTAESLFSHSVGSALGSALRNVTKAKFSQARNVTLESRNELLTQYRALLRAQRAARASAQPTRSRTKARARRRKKTTGHAPRKVAAASAGAAHSGAA